MDYLTTACFTGHRPQKIGGYDKRHPLRVAVRERLRQAIGVAVAQGYRTFISGMALGVDQEAAEIVVTLRDAGVCPIKLVAALPFVGQESRWPAASQTWWNYLLARADHVEMVSAGTYSAYKMQTRNEWMVDRSRLVIAVYDGTSGGTKNCLDYAFELRDEARFGPIRQFVVINPELVLQPGYVAEEL